MHNLLGLGLDALEHVGMVIFGSLSYLCVQLVHEGVAFPPFNRCYGVDAWPYDVGSDYHATIANLKYAGPLPMLLNAKSHDASDEQLSADPAFSV